MSHWDARNEEERNFLEYLNLSKLGNRTIREYQKYFRIFPIDIPLTEKLVWNFISAHSGKVARAFVKNYLAFKKNREIEIPKIRGRPKERLMNLISEEEYELLRKALYQRNIKWGLIFDISYWTGLRRAEVCKMEPSWLRLEEFKADKPLWIEAIGKGDKERYIVLPAHVGRILFKYVIDRFEAHELGNKDQIFKVTGERWWKVLTEMSIRILGKRYKPHELRHTRATLWFKEGVDIIKIQKRLGHVSLATTEKYTHISNKETAEDWEKDLSTKS